MIVEENRKYKEQETEKTVQVVVKKHCIQNEKVLNIIQT